MLLDVTLFYLLVVMFYYLIKGWFFEPCIVVAVKLPGFFFDESNMKSPGMSIESPALTSK